MTQMESVYCAVRTETKTQVNLSIRWLTVVTWTEGNACVRVCVLDMCNAVLLVWFNAAQNFYANYN
jgi:hypothetical protein